MKWIFNSAFIENHQILFYCFAAVIISIIIFAFVMAYKEIKNDNK